MRMREVFKASRGVKAVLGNGFWVVIGKPKHTADAVWS